MRDFSSICMRQASFYLTAQVLELSDYFLCLHFSTLQKSLQLKNTYRFLLSFCMGMPKFSQFFHGSAVSGY